MKTKKIIFTLQSILTFLIILSVSISIIISFRQFYYWHIEPLELTKKVTLDEEEIKEAFDNVLDFCTGKTETFSAGKLPFSKEGYIHFNDVKRLITINTVVLIVSSLLLITSLIVFRKKKITLAGHRFYFWGSISLLGIVLILGIISAIDFSKTFLVFHKIFFSGNEYWYLSGETDPVIHLFPMKFFSNCALLFLGEIITLCSALIFIDIKKSKR